MLAYPKSISSDYYLPLTLLTQLDVITRAIFRSYSLMDTPENPGP